VTGQIAMRSKQPRPRRHDAAAARRRRRAKLAVAVHARKKRAVFARAAAMAVDYAPARSGGG